MSPVQSGRASANRISAPACTIREASLNDYQAVTDLQARYGLATKSYDDWAHLWTNNPAYAEVKKSWPMGWVLEDALRRTVGYLGNIPLYYQYGLRRLIVSTSYAWVVDQKYRSYSMWLLDTYFRQPVDLFLNTTVGAQAISSFTQYGSLPVPVGVWDACAFRITNYRGFAESALRQRNTFAPRFLAFAAAPVLYLSDRLRQIPRSRLPEFEVCNSIDPRFDLFANELMSSFPERLIGDRSSAVLNWHFGPALARHQVWIVAHAPQGKLKAYGIFLRQDNPAFGLTRVRLVDFQSLEDGDALRVSMIRWAVERCRREGIQMLELMGFEAGDRQLAALLPRRRTLTSWQYYYLARDQALARQLKQLRAWRPYAYDGDASL